MPAEDGLFNLLLEVSYLEAFVNEYVWLGAICEI